MATLHDRETELAHFLLRHASEAPEIHYNSDRTPERIVVYIKAPEVLPGRLPIAGDATPALLADLACKHQGDYRTFTATAGRARAIHIPVAAVVEAMMPMSHLRVVLERFARHHLREDPRVLKLLQREIAEAQWFRLYEIALRRRSGGKPPMPRSFEAKIPDVEAIIGQDSLEVKILDLYDFITRFDDWLVDRYTSGGVLRDCYTIKSDGRDEYQVAMKKLVDQFRERIADRFRETLTKVRNSIASKVAASRFSGLASALDDYLKPVLPNVKYIIDATEAKPAAAPAEAAAAEASVGGKRKRAKK